MNKCFFITSAINISNDNPLFYHGAPGLRTAFTFEERLRQTFYSINSIRLVCPNTKIFVVDISKDYAEYEKLFPKFGNVEYISCEKFSPSLAETCRTSQSKGLCESLITLCFLQHVDVSNFDYLIKLSGRYFYTSFDNKILNHNNTDKYFVKQPGILEWQDHWQFPNMLNQNGKLSYCLTQTYALGNKNFLDFRQRMQNIATFYIDDSNHRAHVDFEALFSYYVLTGNNIDIIPWTCGGWYGTTGRYHET